MDNNRIADFFSLLSKLMDIHGENSFKAKNYAVAAFAIEKLPVQLSVMPREKIASIKNIGSSSAQKIIEILDEGKLTVLEDLVKNTPPGVIEMLNIKGVGPKKINVIWKDMQIETVGELLYACRENRLKLYKGFGEKTQQNIIDVIEFYQKNQGRNLYASIEDFAIEVGKYLQGIFEQKRLSITGAYKRKMEIVDTIDFIIGAGREEVEKAIPIGDIFLDAHYEKPYLVYKTNAGIAVRLLPANEQNFVRHLIATSSSPQFFEAMDVINNNEKTDITEEGYFNNRGIPFIPAEMRESRFLINRCRELGELPSVIGDADVKGIIHCHSNWSDGGDSIEDMAQSAMEQGYEYIVISDHSRSAFYAQGLSIQKIMEQHKYIDELNSGRQHFRIFKGIESDILNDGSLDYPDEILATFDVVIASIHSNLKMPEDKAMMRLIKAIENPYTTILGHLTGRLLLSRNGYPVNHKMIIDACAANNVVIELNANPHRLDIAWQHIEYALEKNVLISINPDSHSKNTFNHVQYGVNVARKALLPKEKNLSSFSLHELEKFILNRKKIKGVVI